MNGAEERHINKRVHEEGVSLRDYFTAILNERDRALDERARSQKEAVDAALLAAKEAVNAALAAAEKAVDTAKAAQERVNEKQNELRQMAEDQQRHFAQITAVNQSFAEVTRRLEQLEEQARTGAGVAAGVEHAQLDTQRVRNMIYPVLGLLLTAATIVVGILLATR